jgi:hypothetical protein
MHTLSSGLSPGCVQRRSTVSTRVWDFALGRASPCSSVIGRKHRPAKQGVNFRLMQVNIDGALYIRLFWTAIVLLSLYNSDHYGL